MKLEIEFKEVTLEYEGLIAIREQNVFIRQGEFIFVVGNSGSGKSSFLKLAGGYLKPTKGQILINGEDFSQIEKKDIPYIRRKIGLFDVKIGLIEGYSVYENLKNTLVITNQLVRGYKKKILGILELVDLKGREDFSPSELSGGEKARALLARALVLSPQLLILDEPTASLSETQAWDFMQLVNKVNKMGVTVLIASHDKTVINMMNKRVITIVQGVIVSDEIRGKYDSKKMDIFEERRISKINT